MIPVDMAIKVPQARPERLLRRRTSEGPQEVFIASGYGMVATGKTMAEANESLWEKIRQAREV